MSELATVTLTRAPLPFVDRHGNTVSVADGRIYLNARPLAAVDALDLSAALARAVTDTANHNHTRKEAAHGC